MNQQLSKNTFVVGAIAIGVIVGVGVGYFIAHRMMKGDMKQMGTKGMALEGAMPMKDMEPMTDLLTVFLGFGIFNTNSAARLLQWQNERRQGWSMNRLGYLPEEIYGYALARFAHQRGERRPQWIEHLSTNVRSYFKKSAAWLEHREKTQKAPIG